MPFPRVFTAAGAVAVGLALLTSGGTSYASWAGGTDVHARPMDQGVLRVESLTGLTLDDAPAAEHSAVVVPGETLTFVTTAEVTVQGTGHDAILRLDTADLFATAPAALRDPLAAGLTVSVEGLPRAGQDDNAWLVPAREDPYQVTAVLTLTVPDLAPLEGEPLAAGDLSWSLMPELDAAQR